MSAPSIPAQATGSMVEIDAVKSAPSIPAQATGSRVEVDMEDFGVGDACLSLSAFVLARGSLCVGGDVGSGLKISSGDMLGSIVGVGTTRLAISLGQVNMLCMVHGLPGVGQGSMESVGSISEEYASLRIWVTMTVLVCLAWVG